MGCKSNITLDRSSVARGQIVMFIPAGQ